MSPQSLTDLGSQVLGYLSNKPNGIWPAELEDHSRTSDLLARSKIVVTSGAVQGLLSFTALATNYGMGLNHGVPNLGRKLLQDCLLSGGKDRILLKEEIEQSVPSSFLDKIPTDKQFFAVRKRVAASVCNFEMLFKIPPLYVIGVKIGDTLIDTKKLVEYSKDGLIVIVRKELPNIGIYEIYRFYVRNSETSTALNITFQTIVGDPERVLVGTIFYVNGIIPNVEEIK
ncbi:unnamed protein product [Gordionus sp. m RMFG-2023]